MHCVTNALTQALDKFGTITSHNFLKVLLESIVQWLTIDSFVSKLVYELKINDPQCTMLVLLIMCMFTDNITWSEISTNRFELEGPRWSKDETYNSATSFKFISKKIFITGSAFLSLFWLILFLRIGTVTVNFEKKRNKTYSCLKNCYRITIIMVILQQIMHFWGKNIKKGVYCKNIWLIIVTFLQTSFW